MIPLTFAPVGQKCLVKKICGKSEIRQHLCNLGFVENCVIFVVSEIGGNLIVKVKESRIGISKEMANRIVIETI